MKKHKAESFSEPRRVEILRPSGTRPGAYFKVGQYGYALGWDERGGNWCVDTDKKTRPGTRAYLISKTKEARGGALWFSESGIRFTTPKRGGADR
jgi:hypothetical protein